MNWLTLSKNACIPQGSRFENMFRVDTRISNDFVENNNAKHFKTNYNCTLDDSSCKTWVNALPYSVWTRCSTGQEIWFKMVD